MRIAVFNNADEEIEKLDLSFLNLKILKVTDNEVSDFKKYIHSISSQPTDTDDTDWGEANFGYYLTLVDTEYGYHEYLYAFVPIEKDKTIDEETFFTLEALLLIMFPSDLYLYTIDNFQFSNGGYRILSHWNFISAAFPRGNLNGGYLANHLSFDENKIEEINKFIKNSFGLIKRNTNPFYITIDSYISSYKQRLLDMAFIHLCIGLEALTGADTEIVHQISRTSAVICSDDKPTGWAIYNNVKKFYGLRSKIVHGSEVPQEKLNKYFFKVRALVSRVIIELITLNKKFPEKKLLNEWVIENGFGDKHEVEGYIKSEFNKTISDLILEKADD